MNTLRQNTGVILWILVISFGVIWTLQDSDVFSAMNNQNRSVATVNGSSIQREEYQRILQRQRQRFQQQLGGNLNPQMQDRVREQAYNQVVNQELLQQEMTRLGLSVTDSEVEEMVFGENPHPVIRRQFADSTGRINYELLQNMAQNPEAKSQWLKLEQFLRRQRQQQKMTSLVQSTIQISEQDVEDAINTAHDDCNCTGCEAALRVTYDGILRAAELTGIRRDDLDLQNGTLDVRAVKGSMNTTISLDPATVDALDRHIRENGVGDVVFTNTYGNGWKPSSWCSHFRNFHHEAGAHSFGRHSPIVHRLQCGEDFGDVYRRARHSHPQMTTRYARVVGVDIPDWADE